MQVVVVEQDAALGQFLARALRSEGHEAEWVSDGEAALKYADAHLLNLMVLDLDLPNLSGLGVLECMQQRHGDCSIIVLMADDQADARVRCLDLGADDCVGKPFSFQELIARCRAHLRRRSNSNGDVLQHGSLVLRRKKRTAVREGVTVDLTAKEFALLEHLIERRGRCCSRSELLREVFYLAEDASTNVVEVYINYLRRKLTHGALAAAPSLIETVRGSGYRIAEPAQTAHRHSSSVTSMPAIAASL